MTEILTGERLVKSFGKTGALRGASVSVARGESMAIMGPSGSGKSTLLHCLAGVLSPDEGQVLFDGGNFSDLGDDERSRIRRSRFGFVFQFGQLVDELTAAENVMLPLLLESVPRRQAHRRAMKLLEDLGIGDLGDQRPAEMSGGEAQRVAVARALVVEPDVIFADEPTGALDSLSGEIVMNHLAEAVRRFGSALVLVTHDPRVAAYADREVVVRDGKISTAGNT